MEEKAKQAKGTCKADKHHQLEPEKTLQQLLLKNLGSHPGLDSKLNTTKPRPKKSQPESGKKNLLDEVGLNDSIPSLPKQEINRSSLIIESTRSTISLSSNSLEKFATSQQLLLAGNNNESSQHMIQFLNALQKQHHHQNKNKSANPSSVNGSRRTPAAQAKSNGTVSTSSSAKSTESSRSTGLAKQQQNQCQQSQHQLQQQHQSRQQRQQQSAKAVNGKVPAMSHPPGTSNHATAEVRGSDVDKRDQPQPHVHMNGKTPKSDPVAVVPATPVTSAPVLAVTSKNSVTDSPSAGSGSSTSQSPSCGTKPTPEQVRNFFFFYCVTF